MVNVECLEFDDLTQEQRDKVIQSELNDYITIAIEHPDYYRGIGKRPTRLYYKILKAHQQAENMKTPWFTGCYIHDNCEKELTAMAVAYARECLYYNRANSRPLVTL